MSITCWMCPCNCILLKHALYLRNLCNYFSPCSYVDYVLDVPMYFVYRNGTYHNAAGQSFRDFLEGKLPALPGAGRGRGVMLWQRWLTQMRNSWVRWGPRLLLQGMEAAADADAQQLGALAARQVADWPANRIANLHCPSPLAFTRRRAADAERLGEPPHNGVPRGTWGLLVVFWHTLSAHCCRGTSARPQRFLQMCGAALKVHIATWLGTTCVYYHALPNLLMSAPLHRRCG